MLKVVEKTRYWLCDEQKRISDIEWEHIRSIPGYTAVWAEDTLIIYDSDTCEKVLELSDLEQIYMDIDEEEYITVKKDGKYGLYNLSGKEIIPIKYDNIYLLDHYISVCENKEQVLYGICDYSGKPLMPIKYDAVWEPYFYDEKMVAVAAKYNNRSGYIILNDPSCDFIEAEDINITKTGKIEVLKNNKWVFVG